MYIGVYCPTFDGEVIPTVILKGREGIWRLLSGKYNCKHKEVMSDIHDIIEPEQHNFFLTELHSSS